METSKCQQGKLPDARPFSPTTCLQDVFYRTGLDDKEIVALSSAYIPRRSRPERSGWGSHKPSILRMNLVQSEERTMYERETGARDVDFCSVTIDDSLNDDVLQQQLHGISRRWEKLQHMEIEFRAQLIARVEIMEMQKNFDVKIKEHATANAKLRNNYTPEMDIGLSGSRGSAQASLLRIDRSRPYGGNPLERLRLREAELRAVEGERADDGGKSQDGHQPRLRESLGRFARGSQMHRSEG